MLDEIKCSMKEFQRNAPRVILRASFYRSIRWRSNVLAVASERMYDNSAVVSRYDSCKCLRVRKIDERSPPARKRFRRLRSVEMSRGCFSRFRLKPATRVTMVNKTRRQNRSIAHRLLYYHVTIARRWFQRLSSVEEKRHLVDARRVNNGERRGVDATFRGFL